LLEVKQAKMGTRSLIYFEEVDAEGNVTVYVVIYQQYDGYPEGVGATLASFLKRMRIVNGYNSNDEKSGNVANGFDCLIPQFIAQEKKGIGNFYIYPANTQPGGDIDWVYRVQDTSEGIKIRVWDKDPISINEFCEMCGVSEPDSKEETPSKMIANE
jgi:hypothetical protein